MNQQLNSHLFPKASSFPAHGTCALHGRAGEAQKSNDNFKLQGSESSLLALQTQTTFVILLHSEIHLHKDDWWCLNYEEFPMSHPWAAAAKTMSGYGLLPK